MEPVAKPIWEHRLQDPSLSRKKKPRSGGLTMVIDKGMGISAFRDLLELAADYIDFIKLGFGTTILTPAHLLKEKLRLSESFGVHLYPGGTFFEVAYIQDGMNHYFETLSRIGFQWLEISDGTIPLSPGQRTESITAARDSSFRVITEIGKKQKGSITPVAELVETFHRDRENGAEYIIVEGRESGRDIGMFNEKGDVDTDYVLNVEQQVDRSRIWWECPQAAQQITLLKLLGADTNLGNVPAQEVLSVESLRRGLRSDTFYTFGSHREEAPL
ncbi:phosphosulfolactate synthase [Kroppenstedtia guangzhouensis]|uniref:Phosphosulfolactate synthase n=1 Tax=Kroppenstedtia guangzhouensis TaxID=1274356 RepID=A0ABQ1GAB4_9BACL|nr:phosphosulfolactate synthase [Kroppenstedtia guangzhouensis]GGA39809.1 phosphosulfolactate synthase [Kroppenstedtia guangzhouensis]